MKSKPKEVQWQAKYIRLLRRHEQMRLACKTDKDRTFLTNHDCIKEKCRELKK